MRESELLIARDRVNLDQKMLEIVHEIAATLRQLDQQFAQYEALRETRLAAIENLRQQTAGFRNERIEFINVLQALTDWGNAVSAEAQSLSQYNAELARLEQRHGDDPGSSRRAILRRTLPGRRSAGTAAPSRLAIRATFVRHRMRTAIRIPTSRRTSYSARTRRRICCSETAVTASCRGRTSSDFHRHRTAADRRAITRRKRSTHWIIRTARPRSDPSDSPAAPDKSRRRCPRRRRSRSPPGRRESKSRPANPCRWTRS